MVILLEIINYCDFYMIIVISDIIYNKNHTNLLSVK